MKIKYWKLSEGTDAFSVERPIRMEDPELQKLEDESNYEISIFTYGKIRLLEKIYKYYQRYMNKLDKKFKQIEKGKNHV